MTVLPNPLSIDELALILILSTPIIIWGYRHGLDAVIIAVVGVLAGMIVSDTLANGVVDAVNTFYNLFNAILTVGTSSLDSLIVAWRSGPGLVNTPEQIQLFGTVIFGLIAYVSFRLAFRQAGGTSSFLEALFGALGGAVTGYVILNFVITRHVQFPQQLQITQSEALPAVTLDANVIVLIALVIIVFGVTSSRRS
jgi:hypothetical protein